MSFLSFCRFLVSYIFTNLFLQLDVQEIRIVAQQWIQQVKLRQREETDHFKQVRLDLIEAIQWSIGQLLDLNNWSLFYLASSLIVLLTVRKAYPIAFRIYYNLRQLFNNRPVSVRNNLVCLDLIMLQFRSLSLSFGNASHNRCQDGLVRPDSNRLLCLLVGFVYGFIVYLCQFDLVIFCSIAFLQGTLLHQWSSTWVLVLSALPFAINRAIYEFKTARDNQLINQSMYCKMYSNKTVQSVQRSSLQFGDYIVLQSNQVIPADCIPLYLVSNENNVQIGSTESDDLLLADERGLTGETHLQRKQVLQIPKGISKRDIHLEWSMKPQEPLDQFYIQGPAGRQRFTFDGAESILFQDTTLHIEQQEVSLVAFVWRIGQDTKVQRKPNFGQLITDYHKQFVSTSQRYIQSAMMTVLMVLLLTVLIDTCMCAFYAQQSNDHPASSISLMRLFIVHLLYQNMMIPMSLRQILMTVAILRKRWYLQDGIQCNDWTKQDVIADVRVVCSDKTGTMTKNHMHLQSITLLSNDFQVVQSLNQLPLDQVIKPMFLLHFLVNNDEPIDNPKSTNTVKSMEEHILLQAVSRYCTIKKSVKPLYKPGHIDLEIMNSEVQHIKIACNLGLSKELLVKGSVVLKHTNEYVVFMQSSEEFLRGMTNCYDLNAQENKQRVNQLLDRYISQFDHTMMSQLHGAPRQWFHSAAIIPAQYNAQLIQLINVNPMTTDILRSIYQLASPFLQVHLASCLVDEFQPQMKQSIVQLTQQTNGLPVHMITGDAKRAAHMIAQHVGFVKPIVSIESTSSVDLLAELARLSTTKQMTLVFDRLHVQLLFEQAQDNNTILTRQLIQLLTDKDTFRCIVWSRTLPHMKAQIVQFLQQQCHLPVLFVGDGVNDLQAVQVATVSVGIKGLENSVSQIDTRASFASTEWHPLVRLIQYHGQQSVQVTDRIVKLVFFKHALTAFSLQLLLWWHGFSSFVEPCNPFLMLLYNACVCGQISTFGSRTVYSPSNTTKSISFHYASWFRWWLCASLLGLCTTWFVNVFFDPVVLDDHFGEAMLCVHALFMTLCIIYLVYYDSQPHDNSRNNNPSTGTSSMIDHLVDWSHNVVVRILLSLFFVQLLVLSSGLSIWSIVSTWLSVSLTGFLLLVTSLIVQ